MSSTPIFDAVKKYAVRGAARYHMPGHKGAVSPFDVTELDETDNLLKPSGVIKQSMDMTARAFGSKKSLFLLGGSTSGNLTMLTALLKEGDKVLLDRGAHISVFSALTLCGAAPEYIYSTPAANGGIIGAPDLNAVSKAVKNNPDAKAVFITSPNAFGITAPLKEISHLCKSNGMYLLVDQAHGAHFAFHEELPENAMSAGADMCVQSFHKTLPALTQTAVLHIGSEALIDAAECTLSLYQTSSPSYLLMSSIDRARAFMEENGPARLDALIKTVRENRTENLLTLKGKDILRLVFLCDGMKAAEILEENNIVPEMHGPGYVVCIVTVMDEPEAVKALLSLCASLPPYSGEMPRVPAACPKMTPREAFYKKSILIPAEKAAGHISKNALLLYPPGIPIVAPGEIITDEALSCLKAMREKGLSVIGMENDSLAVLDLKG